MAIFHTESNSPAGSRHSLTGMRWHFTAPVDTRSIPSPMPHAFPAALWHILMARGISNAEEAEAFLNAPLTTLADPLLLQDMPAAVAAVQDALQRGVRIRIFGDYDADGVTATALLVRALSALGGAVDWYIPHRIEDGYGLNTHALDEARADGIGLGITVDNGITSHEQLAYAQQIGLPMIVTDHHEPDGQLPPALAVLNPKRADSVYPFRELAGVGVAFTLLRALCAARGLPPSAPMRFLDLVTIGTVADVVPLIGENRTIVRYGLSMLNPLSKKVGLAALLHAVGVGECATSYDVAFQIGPRLNAAGRMAHATAAIQTLLTADRSEADTLVHQLCAQNTQRQEEEAHTLQEALDMVSARDLSCEKVLVLDSTAWNPGVIGIVASRVVERFHRPCALIAVTDGVGKGSARARAPFHLWEALHACSHLLHRFGGHRVAAGFEVDAANIAALRTALNEVGERTLSDEDLLPSLTVDAWIDIMDVTTGFARQIAQLAPFGMANPMPVFAAADVLVHQCSRRGQDGSHLSVSLKAEPGGRPLSGMWFRRGEMEERLRPGTRVDVAFTVELNTWQGITAPRLVIKDVMV